jgi:DNA repair photolyase
LLQAINARSRLSVNFSLITLNRRLQRILEPRAPRPSLRLRALAELSAAGIRCNILMMPMIPEVTDDLTGIEQMIRASRRAGAAGIWWRSLFLKPAAARRFLPFIRQSFPQHDARLSSFYSNATYAPRAYDEYLTHIFDRLKRKYGFDPGDSRDERLERTKLNDSALAAEGQAPLQLSLGKVSSGVTAGARGGT